MASSISTHSVQLCEICECEPKVTVKCMDCNRFMCNSCKSRSHSKFKNADTHTVLGLSEIAEYEKNNEDLSVEFKPIKCNMHRRKWYSMYCSTCKEFVCPECISSTDHHQHIFCEFDKGFEYKLKALLKYQKEVEDDTNLYLRRLKEIEKNEDFKRQMIIKDLEEKNNQAVQELLNQFKDAVERIKSKKTLYDSLATSKQETISKGQDAIEDEKNKLTKLSKSGDMAKFEESANRFRERLRNMKDCFSSKHINLLTIMATGGIPQIQSNFFVEKIYLGDIKIKVVAQYETNTSLELDNTTMACDREGCILFTCHRLIYRLDPERDNPVEEMCPLNITPCPGFVDQIWSPSIDEIFILCEKSIFKKDSKTWRQIADVSSWQPKSVCTSLSGEIIVGMCFNAAKSEKEDKTCLLFLQQDGQIKGKITTTDMRMKYGSITHCCLLKDDTICFSETDGKSRGRVVKLKKDKSFDLSYERNNTSSADDRPFCPVALCVTTSENLVVLTKSNGLDIITNRFHLIIVIDLYLVGIKDAALMCEGRDSVFWIKTGDHSLFALKGVVF